MFSNLPPVLFQQDFQSSNHDMLCSARSRESLTKEQIERARKPVTMTSREIIHREMQRMLGQSNCYWAEAFDRAGAKIGDTLRIRLPNDFSMEDGPRVHVGVDPAKPGLNRIVGVEGRQSGKSLALARAAFARVREHFVSPACETCGGAKEIDQQIGGAATAGVFPCPDCC